MSFGQINSIAVTNRKRYVGCCCLCCCYDCFNLPRDARKKEQMYLTGKREISREKLTKSKNYYKK